jgi:hypothetical protein
MDWLNSITLENLNMLVQNNAFIVIVITLLLGAFLRDFLVGIAKFILNYFRQRNRKAALARIKELLKIQKNVNEFQGSEVLFSRYYRTQLLKIILAILLGLIALQLNVFTFFSETTYKLFGIAFFLQGVLEYQKTRNALYYLDDFEGFMNKTNQEIENLKKQYSIADSEINQTNIRP